MHQLSFTRIHSYADRDAYITVPVALRSGAKIADFVASLDTGASQCLFENAYAAELGLDLTSGVLTRFRTANSSFDAYEHEVEIDVLGVLSVRLRSSRILVSEDAPNRRSADSKPAGDFRFTDSCAK